MRPNLAGLVEFAKEIVEHFHEFFNRQLDCQRGEVDDVGEQDAHLVVLLDVSLAAM